MAIDPNIKNLVMTSRRSYAVRQTPSVQISLEALGTVAFAHTVMLELAVIDARGSGLDLRMWLELVPEVYREQAAKTAERIGRDFLGYR